MPISIAI